MLLLYLSVLLRIKERKEVFIEEAKKIEKGATHKLLVANIKMLFVY